MSEKRSRTVLSSGDLHPVLDSGGVGGGENSVFAKALLAVLAENNEILEGQKLYDQIAALVAYAASAELEQIPRYGPITYAGHESGDFLFVPKQSMASIKHTSEVKSQVSEYPSEDSIEVYEPPSQTQAPKVT